MTAETLTRTAKPIAKDALHQLFLDARTHGAWHKEKISPHTLKELYRLTRMAPTSANASPARFVFLTTDAAKERLIPALAPMNVEKTRTAPVTVLIGWDTEFHEQLPKLMPYANFRDYFHGNEALIHETAFRNSSLQGGYFILAARALGLDVGAMSGFDAEKVNAEFFPDGKWKVNFIVNLGHGDHEKLFPRQPRLEFEEAAQIL
jgi:3-hydroxypropanoate dehydrogenase